MEHFLTDMSNRVEHQNEPKRPQSGGRLGSFWFVVAVWVRFGFQLGLRQWEALIILYTMH